MSREYDDHYLGEHACMRVNLRKRDELFTFWTLEMYSCKVTPAEKILGF